MVDDDEAIKGLTQLDVPTLRRTDADTAAAGRAEPQGLKKILRDEFLQELLQLCHRYRGGIVDQATDLAALGLCLHDHGVWSQWGQALLCRGFSRFCISIQTHLATPLVTQSKSIPLSTVQADAVSAELTLPTEKPRKLMPTLSLVARDGVFVL
jgi:hypothetical protein